MCFLPILLYHQVGAPGGSPGARPRGISTALFASQMACLAESGYRCIPLRDALPYLRGEARAPARTAVLTFDDGYRDFRDEARPILERHGFSATVFVVPPAAGSAWPPAVLVGRLLGWPEIRELHADGVEIGSHTINHPVLTDIPLDAAREEIAGSRRILEEELGAPVASFAYPRGRWDRSVEKLVIEAGYALACSTLRGNLNGPRTLFHLKRAPAGKRGDLARFRRKLSPLYDYTSGLSRLLTMMSWRRAGR